MTKYTLHLGDCRKILPTLPERSVHCCITSPPYFGLRDYGVTEQIGLEATPERFTSELVSVFRHIRRVLRDDGTLWLNLGDSYARTGGTDRKASATAQVGSTRNTLRQMGDRTSKAALLGLKEKDLIGIPWRVAFALQADGWYLRQDIVWHKPNAMPESVQDRCTKAHEYLFLLTKGPRYYFDNKAIQEESAAAGTGAKLRNRRTVWTVATRPYKGAHFATFPPELVEPCVLAGSPVGGNVLDPFSGSGTTGQVALANSRNYIGCELNPEYQRLAADRLQCVTP